MRNNDPKFEEKIEALENRKYRPLPTKKSTPQRSNRSTVWIVIIPILVLIGICLGLNATPAGTDFINTLMGNPTTSSANSTVYPVQYNDVSYYEGQWITLQGYVIIPRGEIVCFGGWRICKLWFDDDPWEKGLGLHEVQIQTGRSANHITINGNLFDFGGNKLPMTENQVFNWYRIRIVGEVIDCDGVECSINVESIQGIK